MKKVERKSKENATVHGDIVLLGSRIGANLLRGATTGDILPSKPYLDLQDKCYQVYHGWGYIIWELFTSCYYIQRIPCGFSFLFFSFSRWKRVDPHDNHNIKYRDVLKQKKNKK
jgi:hypothetical protein